jgi:hypothetical protein
MNTQHQPDTTKINNYGLGNGSSMQDTMHLDYSQVTGALELVTIHNHPLWELRCHQVLILAESGCEIFIQAAKGHGIIRPMRAQGDTLC